MQSEAYAPVSKQGSVEQARLQNGDLCRSLVRPSLTVDATASAYGGAQIAGGLPLRRQPVRVVSCGSWLQNNPSDFARFLDVAVGSASEVECQLLLSHDLGYLRQSESEDLLAQVVDVKRMLAKFIATLRKSKKPIA